MSHITKAVHFKLGINFLNKTRLHVYVDQEARNGHEYTCKMILISSRVTEKMTFTSRILYQIKVTPISTLEPVSLEATTVPTEAETLESKTVTEAMDSTKIAPTDSQIIHKLMTTDATTTLATSLPTSITTSVADVKTLQPVISASTTEKVFVTEEMSTMQSEIPVTASTELVTSTTVEQKTMSPMTTMSALPATLAPVTLQATTSDEKTAETFTEDIATSVGTSTTLETKQATEFVTNEIKTVTEVNYI